MNVIFEQQEKQQEKNNSILCRRKTNNASIYSVNVKLDNTCVYEVRGAKAVVEPVRSTIPALV